MRILFLSNLYPPYSLGGYELWCQEVAAELKNRGHEIEVITATAGAKSVSEYHEQIKVHRVLSPELEGGLSHTILKLLFKRKSLEEKNLVLLARIIEEYKPDLALIWGMWNIPRNMPEYVEHKLGKKVSYYLCDYWLSLPNAYIQRLREPSRRKIAGLPKKVAGSLFLGKISREKAPRLLLQNPMCVSDAVRQVLVERGVAIQHAVTIHGGIQTERFLPKKQTTPNNDGPIRIAFVGRLVADKGVHTAIKGVGVAVNNGGAKVKFDIFGRGPIEYESLLRSIIRREKLDVSVVLKGSVPHHNLPEVLSDYQVLIFSSEWDEPFARTVLEGMAAGLVVIGTTTGGTKEILTDRVNGLTFQAGDEHELARQIIFLSQNPHLISQYSKSARDQVANSFTLTKMVDEIEQHLLATLD